MNQSDLIAELEHVAWCDYTIPKELLDRAVIAADRALRQLENSNG